MGAYGTQGIYGRFDVGEAVGEGIDSGMFVVDEEVAHVRARFAIDPATPSRLADAWQAPTGTTEEGESELIDTVADCLSVGLPLDAAIASWRAGSLEVSDREDDDSDDEEEEDADFSDDDETAVFHRQDG
jgi:hypothetical protein